MASRSIRALLLALVVGVSLSAQDVTLPAPVVTTQTKWLLDDIVFDVNAGRVILRLKADQGPAVVQAVYNAGTNPTGAAMMNAINTANLSTTCANQAARNCGSLRRRVFDRLKDDGFIEGDVQ